MKPLSVVYGLDKMLNGDECVSERCIFVDVYFFDLDRSHERFRHRIVVRVAFAAHADRDSVIVKYLDYSSQAYCDPRSEW